MIHQQNIERIACFRHTKNLACSQSFIIAFSRVSGRYVKHFSDAKLQKFWLALSRGGGGGTSILKVSGTCRWQGYDFAIIAIKTGCLNQPNHWHKVSNSAYLATGRDYSVYHRVAFPPTMFMTGPRSRHRARRDASLRAGLWKAIDAIIRTGHVPGTHVKNNGTYPVCMSKPNGYVPGAYVKTHRIRMLVNLHTYAS